MGAILRRLIASPEAKQFILYILSALLGGMTASEMHEPKLTASWMPRIFRKTEEPANPSQAIGRISFGRSGCTATIIGPYAKSATKLRILTAAHCVQVGQVGTMKLKNGQTFTVRCETRDKQSDSAWLTADRPKGSIPFAKLAKDLPAQGDSVWHQGYGIDRPENREEGKYLGLSGDRLQLTFSISVSPGDSGGGIVCNASGEILSPVCCTTRLAGLGTVWGAHPARSLAIVPTSSVACCVDEPPLLEPVHPVIPLPHPDWPPPPPDGVE